MFLTSATTALPSTDVAYYNGFVQQLADSAGSLVASAGAISWKAIVSSSAVDARDNAPATAPIYLVGTPENGLTYMGDATFYSSNGPVANPNTYETGVSIGNGKQYVWTGSNGDGTAFSQTVGQNGCMYGDTRGPLWGSTHWIYKGQTDGTTATEYPLYALSGEIVIPSGR
jgi:hypothetical protein